MQALDSTTSIHSATFWSPLKPGEHLVQCWQTEESLLAALEGFVSAGLREEEGVILIATAGHLHVVEKRLRKHWLDIDRARWEGRYIPLLAQETLARFMGADGLPDEGRFNAMARKLLDRASAPERKVRFFGEMVGVLWAQGNIAGAIQLENVWDKFIHAHGVPLFCAYPRQLFGDDKNALQGVQHLHSVVLPG
jgi:hypothetical protein